jgi:ATP-binding cassette subfamily B multidrug efflux pump
MKKINFSASKKDIYIRLLSFTKPYRFYLIGALISALISVALSLLAPVLIGDAIDYIIGPSKVNFEKILKILIYLASAILISSLFQWLMTFCTNEITFFTVKDLRNATFAKLNRVPLKYIDSNSHGDIMNSVINDIDQVSDGLLQGFSQLFTGLITILGTLVFMLNINIKIALIVVILTPLSLFVASFITRRTFSQFKKQSAIRGELSGYIEEIIGSQKIVKAFCYENRSFEHFKEINQKLYDCGVLAQFYSSLTNPCTRFVNGIVYAAVCIIGAVSVINGLFSVGQLSCFLSYANQYTKPFNEISGVVTELQAAVASARRIFHILDEEPEISDENGVDILETMGKIDIENVSFSYQKEQPLIENFNLHVLPGQKIAIVGPTGCGKTTLINLLMRFYDVDSGSISIDGINIKNMKRQSLRNLYGMVLQETWLFQGTIQENIAYGKQNASFTEVIQAAKAAHADSFIRRLPDGYHTIITEDGNISQGQKQLLCIARIMLNKPPMLILDEATSNIDTRTEIQIQRAFAKLMENRTSFIVAHRLSTIKEADVILVMNNGHIIEQGSHEELLKKNGFYASLYNSQFAGSN